jgi:hypothetical protein
MSCANEFYISEFVRPLTSHQSQMSVALKDVLQVELDRA